MSVELNTLSYILLTSILGAATVIAIQNNKHPDAHPLVLHHQSELSSLRYPRESAIVQSKYHPGKAPILCIQNQSITTLSELYEIAISKWGVSISNKFLGSRDLNEKSRIVWTPYAGSMNIVRAIFSGLVSTANLVPCAENKNSFVGIYASTSPDSFMTEIACHWGGLVTVPIAAQATSSHILHVIRNTLLTVLVIDETHLEFVLRLIEGTSIKHVIVITDEEDQEDYSKKSKYFGVSIQSFYRLIKCGQDENISIPRSDHITSDTMASIYYNSNPKNNVTLNNSNDTPKSLGVILTHKNILSAISNFNAHSPINQKLTSKDRLMHSFAIDNILGYILQSLHTYIGAEIVFEDKVHFNEFNLDVESVLSTIKQLKPTIYASGAPFMKQTKKLIASKYGNSFLFKRGLNRKDRYLREGRLVSDCIYDMLVFRDIRSRMFGGQVRTLFLDDDSSDTTVDLASFYRAILGTQVIKTFSRPETTSGMTATVIYDYNTDKKIVGPPLASVEIKLADHKEYTAEDLPNPRGEIKAHGDNVFAGYLNDMEATLNVVDPDGWFSTSMIGELLPNGSIRLLGLKN